MDIRKEIIRWIAKWPLKVHYFFADYLLYPIVYHVIRYRRELVAKNLRLSFPNNTSQERKVIEKQFYHHFCNVVVESLYGWEMSDAEIRERVTFSGLEEIEPLIKEYGGIMIMMGHMGNWEWQADVARRFSDPEIRACGVYRQLKSAFMDDLMKEIRHRRSNLLAEKNVLLRVMVAQRSKHEPTVYGMIADQKPSPKNSHDWFEFLHQETSFLDGSEVLGKKFKYPIAYIHVSSSGRGRYHGKLVLLSEHPETEEPFAITRRFAKALEENIEESPYLWLWTHNRWKYKKEEA